MTKHFRSQIRKAINNADLQAALDANALNRFNARQDSYSSLDEDMQILRKRAHKLRESTINDLGKYLDMFIQNAESNGIIVHQADDANHAVEIALEIAQQHGTNLIAKSKTMVSEEIKLNKALEKHNIRVVETDLGEFIVQLRGEPPAHIITPAVHLSRKEVGKTFQDKLGIPYTDNISLLNTAARENLREIFLNADVGISGVNFGVAENGTLCIITNEGNGRMVTTLPDVHIALMGIERLVPTFDDLALMLSLLPRSATGQKITVYTNLINSPQRQEDCDGPRERHVILVDNGRQALQNSRLKEALLCIRCGACINACPVFREIGGHSYVDNQGEPSTYPGPIGSVISPGLFGYPEFGHLARASSLCGECKQVCPIDIDLPKLILRVRSGEFQPGETPQPKHIPFLLGLALSFFSLAALNSSFFNLSQRLIALLSRLFSPFSQWIHLPAFTGWGYSKDFPRPAIRPFRNRWKTGKVKQAIVKPSNTKTHTPNSQTTTPTFEKSLKERFKSELIALGGNFNSCNTDQAAANILNLLKERGVYSIQSWEKQHFPPGLLDSLTEAGIKITHEADPKIKVGLTGASAAIAETGTLVISAGSGKSLQASLLPEIHLVILSTSDILKTLAEGLNLSEVREASSTVLVSGPSRTADIEMTLTIGVHGPGEVHVFCLD